MSVARLVRRIALAAAACGIASSSGMFALATASRVQSSPPSPAEQQARVACAGCHAFPPADILPRDAWRASVVKMRFIRENRQPPVGAAAAAASAAALPQDFEQALAFYLSGAPERLPAPDAWPAAELSPLKFVRGTLTSSEMPGAPAVSHLRLVDVDGDKQLDVLGTDMRQGVVFRGRALAGGALSVVASIPHPSHVTMTDLDGDGLQDLLVGELGEFFPADHDKGAAIWMRGLAGGKFGAFWLDGWPRVAAVRAADFNGDGRNDLAVAAFGWRKSGSIAVVENTTTVPSRPAFTNHKIDARTGGIDIIPADLNRDGKMDFVTLLAQEHETVLAYINTGKGGFSFEPKVIYAAPHPNWGSSGLQLVDLDRDGDLDVLLTHGDTFDDGIVKPYHGIQWLENTGGYPFVERTLARMPGVHSARAADLDGDGDLDVAASALLAGGSDVDERTLPAVVWLEQTGPGTFARHTIAMGFPRHATLDVGDIDGDGDIDIAVGNFSLDKTASAWVDLWTNPLKP